jgi:hypothetical protein
MSLKPNWKKNLWLQFLSPSLTLKFKTIRMRISTKIQAKPISKSSHQNLWINKLTQLFLLKRKTKNLAPHILKLQTKLLNKKLIKSLSLLKIKRKLKTSRIPLIKSRSYRKLINLNMKPASKP